MRPITLFLFFVLPLNASARPHTVRPPRLRVSLVNMSSGKREVLTDSGRKRLPLGTRVDIDVEPGSVLRIVSDMDSHADQQLRAPLTAEVRLLIVH